MNSVKQSFKRRPKFIAGTCSSSYSQNVSSKCRVKVLTRNIAVQTRHSNDEKRNIISRGIDVYGKPIISNSNTQI